MMLPAFLDSIEVAYQKSFTKKGAVIFTPDDPDEKERYLRLLQQAIDRGSPLTMQELEDFFGQTRFDHKLEIFSDFYHMTRDELLETLQ
jgi:uncharacterized protein YfbU (UPF0304 family)